MAKARKGKVPAQLRAHQFTKKASPGGAKKKAMPSFLKKKSGRKR
jgi:hypothetical protein